MFLNTHETEAWWLERMLDKANMVTSYKAYWMMGIIDIITETDEHIISFEQIVNRMIAHACYPVVTYKLSFGIQDRLSHLILYLFEMYPFLNEYKQDKLLDFLCSSDQLKLDKHFTNKRKELYQMVPYRLLSPFFREATRGVKDQKKNRMIVDLALESSESMYVIDALSIRIRTNWMDYINRNQAIIKGWIQYKLILYLQARNPNVPNIPMKLKPPGVRNLTAAKKFWKSVSETRVITDIYTGKLLNSVNYEAHGELSIDHFIPWSFVSHDEFWNLCPTFNHINSAKNDALPSLDKYLDKYCDLHYFAINELKIQGKRKILEDYYTIGNEEMIHVLSLEDSISKRVVESSLIKSIKPIHQIALNQGFRIWEK